LKALFEVLGQPAAVMTKRAGRFLADDLVSRIGALARNWDAPMETATSDEWDLILDLE
jgi:hypothetical protein